MRRVVTFDKPTRERMARVCIVLGITFAELIEHFVAQGLDEFEALERDVVRRRA